MELLVVIIIVGILGALALPDFGGSKERALDKEGKAVLRLIQAAEKIYRMELTRYYPYAGGTDNTISTINQYLRLSLPGGSKWTYTVDATNQKADASRGAGKRIFSIPFTSDTITCTAADGSCPP